MTLRHACAALLVIAVAGCDLWTEPDDGVPPGSRLPASDFRAWLARSGDEPVPDFDVRGEAGQIALQGAFGTAVPCYTFEAYADARGRTIDLSVVAQSYGDACITVIATFGYEGVIRDLAAGTYTFRLSHVYHGESTKVLETEVTVD